MRFFNPIRNNLRGVSAVVLPLLAAQIMACAPCPPRYFCSDGSCVKVPSPTPSYNPAPPSPPKSAAATYGIVATILGLLVLAGIGACIYKACGEDAQEGAKAFCGAAAGSV